MSNSDFLQSVIKEIHIRLKICSTDLSSKEFDVKSPFSAFKFNKTRFVMELGKKYNLDLKLQTLWEYPSINEYAQYIVSLLNGEDIKQATYIRRDKLQKQEPIAIIGLGCRFPGGAHNIDEFWQLMCSGKDSITEVPENRWDINTITDKDHSIPWFGGFLDDVALFDAPFFNINPKEAEQMDPQQRIFLEVAWQALEHAALTPEQLKCTSTGVFVGVSMHDYELLATKLTDENDINAYSNVGSASSAIGARLSYFMGLNGPSFAVDTACSSSLAALYQACLALRSGECDLAFSGGVNLILDPDATIGYSRARMLAPDGRCKTFDAKANGYVRSEGCGVVILKRLSRAIADGDTIYAVIKSTAANQDGASSGLTAPNMLAQKQMLLDALYCADLKPDDIHFFETHGTGTFIGDPIEVDAINQVYATDTRKDPLYLGAIKSQIGHCEAAAGIAGIIKSVLVLHHQQIPGNLHVQCVNPSIDLNQVPCVIPTDTSKGVIQYAAVSSYGFTGTNTHAILGKAPEPKSRDTAIHLLDQYPFVLSAKSKKSLLNLIDSYRHYLTTTTANIEDICYTLAVGRSHFSYRLALSVSSIDDLKSQLAFAELPIQLVTMNENQIVSKQLNELIEGYLSGKHINWNEYYAPYLGAVCKVSLPTYCFDKKPYWITTKKKKSLRYGDSVHELLGVKLPGYGGEIRFFNELDLDEQSLLKDHQLFGSVVFPGAAYIESALACGAQLKKEVPIALTHFSLLKPLLLEVGTRYDYQVSLLADEGEYHGRIDTCHKDETEWTLQATFTMRLDAPRIHQIVSIDSLKHHKTHYDLETIYEQFSSIGLNYGKKFQVLSEAYLGAKEALVFVHHPSDAHHPAYLLPPALLDGAFQAIHLLTGMQEAYIPFSIESLVCYQSLGQSAWIEIHLLELDARSLSADLMLYDEEGVLLAHIKGFQARKTNRSSFVSFSQADKAPKVYIEYLEEYKLPQKETNESAVLYYASQDSIAELQAPTHWLPAQKATSDWSKQHVLVIYEGDLKALVALTQRALREPPLTMTLVLNQAFGVVQDEIPDPDHHAALGLWRVFVRESGVESKYYMVDCNPLSQLLNVMGLINNQSLSEPELIVRADQTYVTRLHDEVEALKRTHQLPAPQAGEFLVSELGIDTLRWEQRPESILDVNAVKIRVAATSLNFRDVLNAMGIYPGDPGDLGCECAGEVLEVGSHVKELKPGDAVVAFGTGLFGSEVSVNVHQVCRLPANLSMVQAAAIPIVFLTADYGLNQLAKIKHGQKVLIHAATGGVGLAAIAMAKKAGAEIYATASHSKQNYLRDRLGIKHIYDSRSTDFGAQILEDTQGQGVDVVLNSLTSEGFIEASLACLKKQGVFLEIGKLNIYSVQQMNAARPDVAYHIIALDTRMSTEPKVVSADLSRILACLAEDTFPVFPINEFPIKDAIDAFHYLQEAQHIGKVVITHPHPTGYKANSTYLITGGTGGLGIALANHLMEQGVRHLVLLSRHEPSQTVKEWLHAKNESGVDLRHYLADVSDEQELSTVFTDISKSGYPLKGIFHTAGVLSDGMLGNLSSDDFTKVLTPKMVGSKHLDKLSRHEQLDYFVLFSSVASLLGSAGQANYAAANAFMDGLAHKRHQQGLPALAINWGAFGGEGMAAHLVATHSAQGLLPLNAATAFKAMDNLLMQSYAQAGLMRMDWSKVTGANTHYLSHLIINQTASKHDLLELLQATPAEKREQILIHTLKHFIAEALHIQDATQIDNAKGFFELGIDSLIAVDLKNKIQQSIGSSLHLSNTLVLDYGSIKALSNYLLEQLHFKEHQQRAIRQVAIHDGEPIAIIGLSATLPGAPTADEFWQLMMTQTDGISEIPDSRWDVDEYYDANPDVPGKMNTRRGGFIKDIDQFDAAFFGISPKEATYLDPQQRLLLMQTWQALEDAGIAPQSLAGSDTGVFIGIAGREYNDLLSHYGARDAINAYIGTGNSASTASGRISYTLGLEGPNLAIDTACSSSLVALNEACERLTRGECQLAIVGGVNALLTPEAFINFSKAGMLSPDGKCKTFDESANGYVRSEGCGIVILKPLSAALADNDRILALVSASGINQDGASSGLTVPNGPAQERLLTQVLNQANLAPEDIDYIECHGTGTSLGDPIEVQAINAVYGTKRTTPLYLGSAKSSIGHLEAAAGIAGLIKTILALNHEVLPAQLHFHQLNSHMQINFSGGVLTEKTPWLRGVKPRRAALSSFGFSGTNSHVIMEEAPKDKERDASMQLPKEWVFVLSAKSKKSLQALISSYENYLKNTDSALADICYTAAVGRNHFNYRIALIVQTKEELRKKLSSSKLKLTKVLVSEDGVNSNDLHVLCEAYLQGKNSQWNAYYASYTSALRKVSLPTYRFDCERYWFDIKEFTSLESLARTPSAHVFLGTHLDIPKIEERIYESLLGEDVTKIVSDHVFYKVPIFAFASYLSTLIEGLSREEDSKGIVLKDISINKAMLFKPKEHRLFQTLFKKEAGTEYRLIQQSREANDQGEWIEHITGRGSLVDGLTTPSAINVQALKKESTHEMGGAELFAQVAQSGAHLGPGFNWIHHCYVGKNYVLAEVTVPQVDYLGQAKRHAGYLDAAFVLGAGKCLSEGFKEICVPVGMNRYSMLSPQLASWIYVELLSADKDSHRCAIQWCDEEGRVLDFIEEMQFRVAPKERLLQSLYENTSSEATFYETAWQLHSFTVQSEPLEKQLVVIEGEIPHLSNALKSLTNQPIHCFSWTQKTGLIFDELALEPTLLIYRVECESNNLIVDYQSECFIGLLHLAQELSRRNNPHYQLLVITESAFILGDYAINPGISSVTALIKTLISEYPTLNVKQLDVGSFEESISLIASVSADEATESFYAYRENTLYVPRLRHSKDLLNTPSALPLPSTELELKEEGHYLITGGLGGLGLQVAQFLCRRGAATLHLVSRSKPNPEAEKFLTTLKEQGIVIETHAVDVSEKNQVNTLIKQIAEKHPLTAVFHLAGILNDAVLAEQDSARIETVVKAKAMGALWLHEATKKARTPLVLFSSITALIGSPGQLNYAIANSYLDSLMQYRRREGLTTIDIQWGSWADVGMAVHSESQLIKRGIISLPVVRGIALLEEALHEHKSFVAIADIRWQKMSEHYNKVPSWLSELITAAIKPEGKLVVQLKELAPKERKAFLKEYILSVLKQTLGVAAHASINTDHGFFELGIDSLMAVELRNKLQMALGSNTLISVAEIFNYPNIALLANYIAEQIGLEGLEQQKKKTAASQMVFGEREPIAVIGMGCRYPGGANSPSKYWELLTEGFDGICEVPKERWDVEEFYSPDPDAPGKMKVKKGGFLTEQVSQFDASFFKISPRQAQMMDPQHRILLEVVWEALEDAGIQPSTLRGTETGVFVGIWHADYWDLLTKNLGTEGVNPFTNFTTLSSASGTIAFSFGLMGPAYSVDTACSSSLVALDGAVKSLQRGECDVAIVAGANLMLTPEITIGFDKAGMLAVDGYCKTFDATANGYARGEGIGVIILKRQKDAEAANDRIYALLKSTRVNHNGPASGITVPNGSAQADLILHALADAQVKPEDVDYIEAHGTGTSLGDPIELSALNKVYRNTHSASHPLYIGSAKSNMGHLEASAGIAGLMKTILMLWHQQIAPNIHFQTLNPKISLDEMPATVPVSLIPWETRGEKRIAGVSSFGATGINAHVIVEEAPQTTKSDDLIDRPKEHLFTLSAKNIKSLEELMGTYSEYLQNSNDDLADICYTANLGRNHFLYRIACIVSTKEELVKKLHSTTPQLVEAISSDEDIYSDDLNILCTAYLEGKNVNWIDYYAPYTKALQKVSLPTYAFDRQTYWLLDAKSTPANQSLHDSDMHPFLIRHVDLPEQGIHIFETDINVQWPEFVSDHLIYDKTVIAGATYISTVISAIDELYELKQGTIQNIEFIQPIILDDVNNKHRTVQIQIHDIEHMSQARFKIFSFADKKSERTLHVQGQFQVDSPFVPPSLDSLEEIKKRCPLIYSGEQHLKQAEHIALKLGHHFHWIQEVYFSDQELLASMRLPDKIESKGYLLYPGFIDSCFQTMLAWLQNNIETLAIPLSINSFSYDLNGNKPEYVYIKLPENIKTDSNVFPEVDIYLLDDLGNVVAFIQHFVTRTVPQSALMNILSQQSPHEKWFYAESWERKPLTEVTESDKSLQANHSLIMSYEEHLITASLHAFLLNESVATDLVTPASGLVLEHDYEDVWLVLIPPKEINPIELPQQYRLIVRAFFDAIKTIMAHAWTNPPRLWIISQGLNSILPEDEINLISSGILGFYKTLLQEQPQWHARLIDLGDTYYEMELEQHIEQIRFEWLMAQTSHTPYESLIAYRHSERYVPRLMHLEDQLRLQQYRTVPEQQPYQLRFDRGTLSSMRFESFQAAELPPDWVELKIEAAALNFRDVLNIQGLYPGDAGDAGSDCCGVITRIGSAVDRLQPGDRVFGMSMGTFASHALGPAEWLVKCPQSLSSVDACTLPTVFITSYVSLINLAQLKKGETVLLHAASGGVGLAAIQIAQKVGARIIATAGSHRKRAYLKKLGVKHVFDSRSFDYVEPIKNLTKGIGVDVVLNFLVGDFIEQTLMVTKKNARFIEIGKRDIYTQEQMQAIRPDIKYSIYTLDDMMRDNPEQIRITLEVLHQGLQDQDYQSLPATTFPLTHIVAAFNYMRDTKHIGKIVLTPAQAVLDVIDPKQSILIIGGLGGIGSSLIPNLMKQGARHLILTGRSPQVELSALQEQYKEGHIEYIPCDISQLTETNKLIKQLSDAKIHLQAVLNTAGVLKDGTLDQLTWDAFDTVLQPKVNGTWNLHQSLLKHGQTNAAFVSCSSIASTIGSPGQANYAAANSFLDAFSMWRSSQHMKAITLCWGPWSDLGMAKNLGSRHARGGIQSLKPNAAINALQHVLHRRDMSPVITIADVHWQKINATSRLAFLNNVSPKKQTDEGNFLKKLHSLSEDERFVVLQDRVHASVAEILGMSVDSIPVEKGFFDLGMDSLMAVELRNQIQLQLGKEIQLNATVIFDYPSVKKLILFLITHLGLRKENKKQEEQSDQQSEHIHSAVDNLDINFIEKYLE